VSRHEIRTPINWPRLNRAHGIGPTSTKCGRSVGYWRSDVLAWVAAQEAAIAKGRVQ
jgi:predicted DNA-binding transcriptional regulator AlpA